jgi:hypothetical protein
VRPALLVFSFLSMMSIAVSAVVAPSRRLRLLLAVYGVANLAAALAVGLLLPGRFQAAPVCALFFLVAGVLLLGGCRRATKTRRIDISGVGQVRLTVQQGMRTSDAAAGVPAAGEPAGVPVALMAGSTVWPQLMLLRLRADSGAVVALPVLRDSVAPPVFRALAVAVGAIGGRGQQNGGAHKIL